MPPDKGEPTLKYISLQTIIFHIHLSNSTFLACSLCVICHQFELCIITTTTTTWFSSIFQDYLICIISRFCHGVKEIFTLLGCYSV